MATLGIFASQKTIPAQVVAPEMIFVSIIAGGLGWDYSWAVKNKDPLSVTIYSEETDTTPDVSRGTVASEASTSTITYSSSKTSVTVYAQAVAISPDTRPSSTIASLYMETGGGS